MIDYIDLEKLAEMIEYKINNNSFEHKYDSELIEELKFIMNEKSFPQSFRKAAKRLFNILESYK